MSRGDIKTGRRTEEPRMDGGSLFVCSLQRRSNCREEGTVFGSRYVCAMLDVQDTMNHGDSQVEAERVECSSYNSYLFFPFYTFL